MVYFLNQDCERAIKYTVPAVRVAVSETLSKKHAMSETRIAKGLGITQVAVSKYTNHKYSARIGRIKRAILAKGLEKKVVGLIISNGSAEKVGMLIDKAASDEEIVKVALKA